MTQDRTASFFDEVTHNLLVFPDEGRFLDRAVGRSCCSTNQKGKNFDLKFKRLLGDYIYARYYSHDNERADELIDGVEAIVTIVDREESSLGKLLAESCRDCYIYDKGWTCDMHPLKNGTLLAKRSGVQLEVTSHDLVATGLGEYALRLPAVRRFALSGWTIVFGETTTLGMSKGECGRHYFPVQNTPTLISVFSEIAHYMNRMRYPFQLKAINNSSRIRRTDNIVLFSPADLAPEELSPLHEILLKRYGSEMKAPPPMTRYMGSGWGFAEERPKSEFGRMSFGQERCGVIAKAIIEAGTDASAEEKIKRIELAFSDNGLDFGKPFKGAI